MAQSNVRPESSDDCWNNALASLDAPLSASLEEARAGRLQVLSSLTRTVHTARNVCIHKQWKVKIPGGKIIILRDVVEKISKWVKLFIAVGDNAVQFNPGAASLAWAAVRFLLQATISYNNVDATMVSDLEIASRMIAKYNEFEKVHLKRESVVVSQIKDALTRLYAGILTFLAKAVKHYKNNTVVRGVKGVFSTLGGSAIGGLLHQEADLLKLAGISDTEVLHHVSDSIIRLVDESTRAEARLNEDDHLKLLRWLSSSPFTRHHEAQSEARMPNSSVWLLQHETFRKWKNDSTSSLLLIHGIPGSGKTKTCSAVIDLLLHECSTSPLTAPVAYVYCSDCEFEAERSRPTDIIRSIVRQLTVSREGQSLVRNNIISEFERKAAQAKLDGMDMPKLSVEDCVRLILEVTENDPITIVVDALDEVNEQGRSTMISAFQRIVADSPNVVKVLVTSRNDSQIFALLRQDAAHLQKIEITTEYTRQDINSYANQEIARAVKDRRLLKEDISPELQDLLMQKLTLGAGEMFQWINVQLEYLCQYTRETDIAAALESGTATCLEDVYSSILTQILGRGGSSRTIAVQAFSWLLYMREAMPLDAFLAVVFPEASLANHEKARNELLSICSHWITFDTKLDTFRFSHQSVQEFLRTQPLFSPSSAQQVLATACLRVCRKGPGVNGEQSLYRYAAIYWAFHCSRITADDAGRQISEDVISFVYDDPGDSSLSFTAWLHQIESISSNLSSDHPMRRVSEAMPNPVDSALFLACSFGFGFLLDGISSGDKSFDWGQKNNKGHTALYLASFFGHSSAARVMLGNGVDPNIQCGNFGNALQAACFNGHVPVIHLLLDSGASVRASGLFRNALESCVRGGSETAALSILKHTDAIRDAVDFESALGDLSEVGFLTGLDYLEHLPIAAELGCDIPSRMIAKISRAIKGGQTGTLTAFMNSANDLASILPDSPVAIAATYGHGAIIELLVSNGIDIKAEGRLGSPIRCAALMGHERITQRLIELGADVNEEGHQGTALQAASMKGHTTIVQLLLRCGAKVNLNGGTYGTAIQAAACHGHLKIVEGLLDAGADANMKGLRDTTLQIAAEGGHFDIVKLLLDKGVCAYHEPEMLSAPLIGATYTRQLLEELLINKSEETSFSRLYSVLEGTKDNGLDDELTRREVPRLDHAAGYDQALETQSSAATDTYRTMKLLIEQRTALRIWDGQLTSAVVQAAKNGHCETFELLLNAASLTGSMEDRDMNEVLESVVSNARLDLIDICMQQASPVQWSDSNIAELLAIVCSSAYSTTLSLLPKVNSIFSAKKVHKAAGSGLAGAATSGRLETVRFLFTQGFNFSKAHLAKALHGACEKGHPAVVFEILAVCNARTRRRLVQELLKKHAGKVPKHMDVHLNNMILHERQDKATLLNLLVSSAGDGHLDTAKALLGASISWVNHQAYLDKALVSVSKEAHGSIVKVLIEAGANPNADVPLGSSSDMISPLQAALTSPPNCSDYAYGWIDEFFHHEYDRGRKHNLLARYEKVVKVLLNHGSDTNDLGCLGHCPLVNAVKFCSSRTVHLLLESGASVNAVSSGCNAVFALAESEPTNLEMLPLLLSAGARLEPGAYSIDQLMGAYLKMFINLFDEFEALPNQQKQGFWVTDVWKQIDAQQHDHLSQQCDAVVQILEHLPSVKASHEGFPKVLLYAAASGHQTCVRLLLERQVEVNTLFPNSGTAIRVASQHGHLEIVRDLLLAGALPNASGGPYHRTALREALTENHPDIAKLLIQHGAQVNEAKHPPDSDAKPLLNLAIELGQEDLISLLITEGIDVIEDPHRWNHPLIKACKSCSTHIIERLLENGAPVDVRGKRHSDSHNPFLSLQEEDAVSPLYQACHYGREDVVTLLLARGHCEDRSKASSRSEMVGLGPEKAPMFPDALQEAACRGHTEVVRLLLAAGATVNTVIHYRWPDVFAAGRSGHVESEFFDEILDRSGRDTAVSYSWSALSSAAASGHLDVVQDLVSAGAIIYEPGVRDNVVKIACRSGCPAVLDYLLEQTMTMKSGQAARIEAFEASIARGDSDSMTATISDYIDLNSVDALGIMYKACFSESRLGLQIALDVGGPTVWQLENWSRALLLSAQHLKLMAVKTLAEAGTAIQGSKSAFTKAMTVAIFNCIQRKSYQQGLTEDWIEQCCMTRHNSKTKGRCREIVRLLLQKGAAVEESHHALGCPLHLACFMGDVPLIKQLLLAGADVNKEAGHFKTSLFAAVHRGHADAVEFLLKEGCQVNVRHPEYRTPLDMALQRNHPRIVSALRSFDGDSNQHSPNDKSMSLACMSGIHYTWNRCKCI